MKCIQTRSTALAIAMIGLALPAAAQDFCAGAGANGQWIGGNESASDIATTDAYREQMALVLPGNEYVALFSVSAATQVRVEAAGRGAGDPLIDLLDDAGNIVLSDDDSGGNGAARGEVMLEPGTYCLSLQSYDGAPMTAFVRIGRTEQEALTEGVGAADEIVEVPMETDPITGGGTCTEARPLGELSETLTGTGSADDAPYWSFSVAEPTAVTITAQNEDADPIVTLYDENENYIDENDDFDGLNSRLDVTTELAPGNYCINVTAYADPTLPIDVAVTKYDPVAALAALYARGEAAPPLDGSVPFKALGALTNRLREDAQVTDEVSWFTVDVNDGGLLLIEAIAAGGNGDPWLVVYDDLGRQVGMNDDYGTGYDALVTARVTPGTYIVGVKQVGEGVQGFVRMVFERYVPAP